MREPSPFAVFDALCIVSKLSRTYQSASLPEVQAVSYLACLLSIYDGCPSSQWGYEFAVTDSMSMFSSTMLEAVDRLSANGLIEGVEGRYSPTPSGATVLGRWMPMHRFRDRVQYLAGATGAADALPLPALSTGLLQEPQVAAATYLGVERPLLGEAGVILLHRYFQTLEESLGSGVDLLVPAVVWLTYLLEQDLESAGSREPGE
ncbi:hypothetical protein [Micromonospora oryzae]|uniref:hypothetical protein n=1 Tax=Micromonospora sp. DSM 102119 TaxID=3111768 RepID=UPI0031D59B6E